MAELPEKITDETEVSTTELATVLGITARRVQQMAQDGTLPTIRKGRFLLADSVQRYIKFLNGSMDEEGKKLERQRQKADVAIKAAKAKRAKLETDELDGKMHRSEDVAAMTEDLIYTIRSALVALPGRLAAEVMSVQTEAEAAEVIRKEVATTMLELSKYQYDPKAYEEKVRGRMNWDSGSVFDDDE